MKKYTLLIFSLFVFMVLSNTSFAASKKAPQAADQKADGSEGFQPASIDGPGPVVPPGSVGNVEDIPNQADGAAPVAPVLGATPADQAPSETNNSPQVKLVPLAQSNPPEAVVPRSYTKNCRWIKDSAVVLTVASCENKKVCVGRVSCGGLAGSIGEEVQCEAVNEQCPAAAACAQAPNVFKVHQPNNFLRSKTAKSTKPATSGTGSTTGPATR